MMAASLFGVFALAKLLVVPPVVLFESGWSLLAYLYQDLALAILFLALERWVPLRWVPRVIYTLLALYTALNVPIARILSTPLTGPILRAARGPLMDSIRLYLSPFNLGLVLLVLFAALAFPWMARRVRLQPPAALIVGIVPLIALVPPALSRLDTLGMHRNATAALALSLLPRIVNDTSAGYRGALPFRDHYAEDLSHLRGIGNGRNVVLVGLESTAARYLRLYGAQEELAPNLSRVAAQGLIFENAYTVYPESIKVLIPVLFSIYPVLDTPVESHDLKGFSSIATVLAGRGYATALFHSGRFMYLGMDSLVEASGFATREDAGDIGGDHNSSFGIDEASTVRRILRWIDSLPKGRPFFATFLPIAGHHPYETPEPGPYSETDEFGRYRNALLYADAALGMLMDGLRSRDLFDSTVWVFYGDHGEAFGQHPGNFGHTFFLYEENVRVPLVVALPGLVSPARRVQRTASVIDLAPTIADLLGFPSPDAFEGRSLLSDKPSPTLFFTDYSLGLLGLRDGRLKFIHELESGRSRLFDLIRDPEERRDISGFFPERVSQYRQFLLSWCASHKTRRSLFGWEYARYPFNSAH